MSFKRHITAGALALLASACATPEPNTEWIDPGMGEATSWNKHVQIINPDPVYPADALQPGYHGEKASEATERYRKDQVKDVETIGTTSVSTSGGGSGPR